MIEVAYFLARYGEQNESGSTAPPAELEVSSWKQAYAMFYPHLGEGRTSYSFANSLKNARDVYDAHIPTGRVGWRQAGSDRPPVELPSAHQSVWDAWSAENRENLWSRIRDYIKTMESSLKTEIDHDNDVQRGEHGDRVSHTEGDKKVRISARVERSGTLRKAAIRIHGTSCAVCGWSFGDAYGEWGEGYAEVHHVEPFIENPGIRETDVREDLVVLCANCHRMAHRKRDQVLTVDELKSKLRASAIAEWANSLDGKT